MKLVSAALAALLLVNTAFAAQYTAVFGSFEDSVACLSKNVLYIKKVSGDVQVHGTDLVLLTKVECADNIQQNLKDVCVPSSVSCQ